MIEGNNNLPDTPLLDYDVLPAPPELDNDLITNLDQHIKGVHWTASHQCITMLRSIIKYFPQYIPDLFSKYGQSILEMLPNSAPILSKNILRLLKEVFMCGANVNVENCVAAFLPLLVRKAASETGQMRETTQQILTVITSVCCYPSTIEIATELTCDKNASTAEIAIKLLAVILQNIGGAMTQLTSNCLQILMKGLSFLINGKRNNMRNSSLDICIFIFGQIGSENYVQLMTFALDQQEVAAMSQAMETHRIQKQKAPHLADVLKQQKQITMQRQAPWSSLR